MSINAKSYRLVKDVFLSEWHFESITLYKYGTLLLEANILFKMKRYSNNQEMKFIYTLRLFVSQVFITVTATRTKIQ